MELKGWMIFLPLLPILVAMAAILLMPYVERQYDKRKEKRLQHKSIDVERKTRVKEKGDAVEFVLCTNCGEQIDASIISMFQKYEYIGVDAQPERTVK